VDENGLELEDLGIHVEWGDGTGRDDDGRESLKDGRDRQ
jgi:hypothetical protein